jgi:hypothetical protein
MSSKDTEGHNENDIIIYMYETIKDIYYNGFPKKESDDDENTKKSKKDLEDEEVDHSKVKMVKKVSEVMYNHEHPLHYSKVQTDLKEKNLIKEENEENEEKEEVEEKIQGETNNNGNVYTLVYKKINQ